MSDPVDDRLEHLGTATADVPLPPGLESRILSRLRDRAIASRWDLIWSACRSAVPIAVVAAALAVSIAVWQDLQLTDALVRSPDTVSDPGVKDP